jgi:hypothetical protein
VLGLLLFSRLRIRVMQIGLAEFVKRWNSCAVERFPAGVRESVFSGMESGVLASGVRWSQVRECDFGGIGDFGGFVQDLASAWRVSLVRLRAFWRFRSFGSHHR